MSEEERGRRDPRNKNKEAAEKEKTDQEKYGEATLDEIRSSRALEEDIGETTKRPAQPPSESEHAKNQDVKFWLTRCKDLCRSQPIPMAGQGGPYQIRVVQTKRITSSILH